MLKRVAWALLHTDKIHPAVSLPRCEFHAFDYMSQELIREFVAADLPERNKDNLNLSKIRDRMFIPEQQFKDGAVEAYKVILNDFCRRADFVASSYCTPKLSFTLNFFNFRLRNIGIETAEFDDRNINISTTILGQWVEMEETRSNDKILGLWDADHIKSEISAGFIGPEVSLLNKKEDDMTYIPIKQTVRLLYEIDYDDTDEHKRIDVFDWERSLSCPAEKEEWTVANINSTLL